jgi:hypothetical protein
MKLLKISSSDRDRFNNGNGSSSSSSSTNSHDDTLKSDWKRFYSISIAIHYSSGARLTMIYAVT